MSFATGMHIQALDSLSPQQQQLVGGVVCLLLIMLISYLAVMKYFFGSYHLGEVVKSYKKRVAMTKRYHELFTSRDNIMFHISWADSRGDHKEAEELTKDLVRLDKRIDELESTYGHHFGCKVQPAKFVGGKAA
jgi:hypothetical protein